jgi:hypothetical protein
MKTKKEYTLPPVDKANCTYWWMMNLDQTHPENDLGVLKKPGYGKFQGHDEILDKDQLLISKIEMLDKYGWLERSDSIEIYKKIGPMPNYHKDWHIVTLYKDHYIIPDYMQTKISFDIKKYLQAFYDWIIKGRHVKFLRPLPQHQQTNRARLQTEDEILNPQNYSFRNDMDLQKFGNKLLTLGRAPGMVQSFIHKYRETRIFFPNK